ncbi:MAG: ribosome recycling factor [Phycisphaerae bacterium]|nr:ribosome recycling factor [Phycisphaerae bacterium]
MALDETLFEAEGSMEAAVEYFRNELRGVRTGRAHVGLVDHLHVEYYGSKTELRQMAAINTPSSDLIVIKPFDPSALKEIERAILASDIGLTPMSDGKIIRLGIPPLSGERRRHLTMQVKKMAEESRVTIRNARRDANKALDKMEKDKSEGVSEDDIKRGKDQVQKLTEQYEAKIAELLVDKEKEIENV